MTESEIIAFYRGAGRDSLGRSLTEIRAFSFDELEEIHDFIQWLFPLPEPSSANPSAPRLTPDDMRKFAAEPELRAQLVQSFTVMLRFYGFVLGGTRNAPAIEFDLTYAARRRVWLRPFNHNFLRISRILRSLCLLGCRAYGEGFLKRLEFVYLDHVDTVGARTIQYWRAAVA